MAEVDSKPSSTHTASSTLAPPVDHEPYKGDKKEKDANMYPEGKAEADADIEAAAEKPAGPPMGMNPADFPDGGFEAWLVVAGAWCALFCSFGWINCIGIFQEYYQHNTLSNLSPSTISWIPSLETFMMFAGGPVFGKIFDNFGPRWLLLGGSVAHIFGLMSMSSDVYFLIPL